MSPDGGRSLRFAILYFVLLVSFSSRLYYARPASGVNSVTDSVHSFCPSDCRELCTSPSACRHGSADNDLAVAPKDGRQGAPNDSPSSACGGGSQAVRPNVDSSLTALSPDAGNFEFSIGYSVMRNICCNRTDQEGPLTHLNFAFVSFRQDYKLTTKNRDFLSRSGLIKARHRHIKTVISIKGWASEGSLPSASWSYITRNWHSRQTFIKSVVEIVNEYDLDGVDFDCVNTPVISGERESSDADNFVSLLADLHELSNARNSTRTISITILASIFLGLPLFLCICIGPIANMVMSIAGSFDATRASNRSNRYFRFFL
ncbi:hypothetical protein XA68_17787 [Ophiocordyceps unilateralis]|uniref:GH18 domain-containing protein n=1 Tax=Ophiocordyceps unilateralis TaxID=268505 RepID=A0A2A9PJ74_OPHUN|nr:hypothetical protein XA68_17787 [Ophiocordyceps unilateralis]